MIDIRKLKELVRLMVEHDLSEVDLRDSEEQVTLRRGAPGGAHGAPPVIVAAPTHAPVAVHAPAVQTATPVVDGAAGGRGGAAADAGLVPITSPMVGTFYASADPNSPPFVNVGDAVSPQRVVCLIEAMKIFNEIKPDVSGRIEKIMVKSGTAVEFGQTLFLVRPD